MAELFRATPLFPGQSELDQIHQIFKVLGTQKLEQQWPQGLEFGRKQGIDLMKFQYEKQDLAKVIPQASPEAIKVIKMMLKVNPQKRASANKLLQSKLFKNSLSSTKLQSLIIEREKKTQQNHEMRFSQLQKNMQSTTGASDFTQNNSHNPFFGTGTETRKLSQNI